MKVPGSQTFLTYILEVKCDMSRAITRLKIMNENKKNPYKYLKCIRFSRLQKLYTLGHKNHQSVFVRRLKNKHEAESD